MTRDEVTELVRDAKRKSGKSWKQLAAEINRQALLRRAERPWSWCGHGVDGIPSLG